VFDHVTIRASDRDAAERFFDTLLPGLGIEKTYADEHFAEWGDFSLTGASDETPATRRVHIGFVAPSRAHVDEFWRIGTEAGYRDDGPPGARPQYRDDYYGAFLLDPDGNSIEAVHHGDMRRGGGIDHIWIRVADVDAARAFYEILAAHGGLRAIQDSPDHAYVAGDSGSFSLVPGDVTEHLHMAFPVAESAAVDAFHRAATEAGYRDNGPPAERPVYHDGYYAAFVLDPDGNNIELVNHNRS
jgi:catechol 2,3-dioxygenase-like lactoylglutathione lyase family enzyme